MPSRMNEGDHTTQLSFPDVLVFSGCPYSAEDNEWAASLLLDPLQAQRLAQSTHQHSCTHCLGVLQDRITRVWVGGRELIGVCKKQVFRKKKDLAQDISIWRAHLSYWGMGRIKEMLILLCQLDLRITECKYLKSKNSHADSKRCTRKIPKPTNTKHSWNRETNVYGEFGTERWRLAQSRLESLER